jgi:acyl carrier protein
MKVINEFIDYVLDFYGNGGIYDMGATREQVKSGLEITIARNGVDDFAADSLDRERIRDIMIEKFGLKFPHQS